MRLKELAVAASVATVLSSGCTSPAETAPKVEKNPAGASRTTSPRTSGQQNSPASGGTADCAILIRIGDTQFVERGFTKSAGESLGEADMSACDDTGANARGPYFPDDPNQVKTLSVPGFDDSDVVAIAYNDHLDRVMVAEDATKDTQAQVWKRFSKR